MDYLAQHLTKSDYLEDFSPEPSGSSGDKLLCSVVGSDGYSVSSYTTGTQYNLKVEKATGVTSCNDCTFSGITGTGTSIGNHPFTPSEIGQMTMSATCTCDGSSATCESVTINVEQGLSGDRLLCSVVDNDGHAVDTYTTGTQYKLRVATGTGAASCSNCSFSGVEETRTGLAVGDYVFTPSQVGNKTVGATCQCDNQTTSCSETITVVQGQQVVCQDATGINPLSDTQDNGNYDVEVTNQCKNFDFGKTCLGITWDASGTGNISINGQDYSCTSGSNQRPLFTRILSLNVPSSCTVKKLYPKQCGNYNPVSVTCNQSLSVSGSCSSPPYFTLQCGGAFYMKYGNSPAVNGNLRVQPSGTQALNCCDDSNCSNEINGSVHCVTSCEWY